MTHSNTINRKSHPLRASFLFGAVASLALTSCAEFSTPLALKRTPPYFALYSGQAPASGHIQRSGFFAEENGCVVFKPADFEPAVTPVFPDGQTQLVTDGVETLGLYLRGEPVAMNTLYRVSGANPEVAVERVAFAEPVPAGCPTRFVVVRHLTKSMGADVDARLYCIRTFLCRSYKLD